MTKMIKLTDEELDRLANITDDSIFPRCTVCGKPAFSTDQDQSGFGYWACRDHHDLPDLIAAMIAYRKGIDNGHQNK